MKRINLDQEHEFVRRFIRSLPVESGGAILLLEGQPILKILPVSQEPVDQTKMKAAIRKRRNESRELNHAWEAVDREMWNRIP